LTPLLQEVDSETGRVLHYWSGGSVDLPRKAGRYTFKEVSCVVGPFIGLRCVSQDTHVVVVGSGSTKAVKPDSLQDQAKYKFTTRSGDFNSDGRVDVLIDRTTSGSVDGSMQSYILYQREGGAVEATKPTDAELKRARGFQTTSKLNLIPNDLNIDGFADHTIENIACWGLHYPAPYEDPADYDKPITNCMIIGRKSMYDPIGIRDPNPIRTTVGVKGKIGRHAIANTTLPGHIFHGKGNPEGCPKKLKDDKDWKTSAPNGCSQVYHEPNLDKGKITMRTRGYGKGNLGRLNDL